MNPVDPPALPLGATLRHLYPLWLEQRRLALSGLGFALAYTVFSLAIPLFVSRTIDEAIEGGLSGRLVPYLLAILGVAILAAGSNYKRRYATARVGVAVEARLRSKLFDAYLRYPRAFYDRHATGEVISRATNDIYPVRYFVGWGVIQGLQSLMMLVGATMVLVTVDARLALVAMLAMPPVAILTWLFAHRVHPISQTVQERKGQLTEATDEAVVGIEMVQAFGREDEVRGRFGASAGALRDETMRQATIEAQFLPSVIFVPSLAIAGVLWLGGRDAIQGNLTIGEVNLFMMLLFQLVWPLEALGWITNLGQRATAAASRSFAWLDGIEPLPEADSPATLPAGPLEVALEDVHFRYAEGEAVLKGVSLVVPAGQIVAVCGRTGSGKTSLLDLLPRLYDPTSGRIQIGGLDARDVSLADLRSAVAIVTQRPVLFSVSLRDNLTAASPDAPWDEVLAACEAAGVSSFAEELPRGYDTLIGERGVNLSGGQRQRVALARALVARARVLVLDDPLSAVDTESELALIEALRLAVAGCTVMLASQRFSTVLLADRVVVLSDGRIVEDDSPRDLLERGGVFTQLFGDEARAPAA